MAKLKVKKHGPMVYPPDHELGMQVPKGGSSCASCEYLLDGGHCSNHYFVQWNLTSKLPAEPDSYCCDLYQEK
jgi:hypothetical protein